MSIFSICLDLWVRYNSQFCWYEAWWNESGPLVPNWNRELRKIRRSRFSSEQKSPDARSASDPKNALSRIVGWVSLGASAHVFAVNASFIRWRKMNMIREKWIWYESATGLSWTHVLFNLTEIYVVVGHFLIFTHAWPWHTSVGGDDTNWIY